MEQTLITLFNVDSKQKIRQVTFEYKKTDEGYIIYRNSGLFGGAIVHQPSLIIIKGKASRTLEQQVQLEFNALISKARDKGYKDSTERLSSVKTDGSGKKKPMLAKDPKGKIETLIKGKKGYASKKLDGKY